MNKINQKEGILHTVIPCYVDKIAVCKDKF